ncbi:hypothetical protein [Kribbella sp. DT2]|uniref:hypothetical protein n=1 Tax=Kribbella sp. DT2 TaxID=3393427 RepID=UPI003CF937F4
MSEDEIGQDELEQAHVALAQWFNARSGPNEPQFVPGSFSDWDAGRREEFLVMAPSGGMSNQLYLVGGGLVHAYSPAHETHLQALEIARGERDGTIPVTPPQPSPF